MRREPVPIPAEPAPYSRRARPAADDRPRRRLWVYAVGLVVLGGTFAVAWNLLHTPSRANGPATTVPGHEPRAVAIAYVDVEGGVRNLYPTRMGRVASTPVEEGVEVPAKTVLLQIDDTLAKIQEAAAGQALKGAEEKLAGARDGIEQHKLKVEALEQAVKAARAKVTQAKVQLGKAQRLAAGEVTSKEAGKENIALAQAAVTEAEAGVLARDKELAAAKLMKPERLVQAAQIEVDATKELQKKAVEDRMAHQLLAPAKGKILRRIANVGEALGANPRLPAVIFCPSGPRIVRAEVEQEFAGRVAVGQRAHIEDDATGSGEWRGKVHSVSDWYTQRRSILLEPLQFNDVRTLEVVIKLEESKTPLRIGQRVRVRLDGN